jgi:GntR family transcriptional repressor for pyruvate dehydrogenase complex
LAIPPFGKLSPIRLSGVIADQIESLILDGQLNPGDKLPPERELATQYGVSRTAVREAMKLLEERGLLQSRNGVGGFVTMPSTDAVSSSLNVAYRMHSWSYDQLDEARSSIECYVASLAAERATAEDIARMDEAVKTMDASLDDPDHYMQADIEFHAALAGATQNPFFLVLIRPLVGLIQDVGREEFFYGNIRERHQNHKQLLDCVRRGDARQSADAMRRHLAETRKAFEGLHSQHGDASSQPPIAAVQDSKAP